jgi:hypothetical protein
MLGRRRRGVDRLFAELDLLDARQRVLFVAAMPPSSDSRFEISDFSWLMMSLQPLI